MAMAEVVAAMLRDAGLTDVYSVPVPVSLCREPIVVVACGYARDAEVSDGERGILSLRVLCVREGLDAANEAAVACRNALKTCDWERWAAEGDLRICGIDAGYPASKGRGKDGRWVVELPVELAVADDE